MIQFNYPTSIQLQEIAQAYLPRLEADRPVFDFFPTVNEDAAELAWEQLDNYIGLQAVRGLNGEFPRVRRIGANRFQIDPGVYGEYEPIDEAMLVKRRVIGTLGDPIDISDLVMPIQDNLLQRRLDRIEWMIWTLLADGTFSVPGETGGILHTDSYDTQIYNAPVPWSNTAASGPWRDFKQLVLKARGYSVSFGADAQAFMNAGTWNNLSQNTNAADIYGRRVEGFATPNSLKAVGEVMQGDNLPEIVIYDRGYYDDSSVFHTFIPDDVVIVVGKRPGNQPVGDYAYTRDANNPDLGPGPFMYVRDTLADTGKPPRNIEVYDGHSGGLRLYYPSAIVIMNV